MEYHKKIIFAAAINAAKQFMDEMEQQRVSGNLNSYLQKIVYISFLMQLNQTSYLEEDDDYDVEVGIAANLRKMKENNPVRIQLYIQDVVHKLSFRTHFRLTRSQFEYLLRMLAVKIKQTSHITIVPVEKQLLSSLWLLATPDSFR